MPSAQDISPENASTSTCGESRVLKSVVTGCGGAWVAFIAILIVNLFLYGRSLNSYFFADDYVHISWLYKVFSGHPELVWQNFWSNWMEAEGTYFYRPLISLTLVSDYLLAGAQPLVFHLSNLIYHASGAFYLFLLVNRLLPGFSVTDRFICSLSTALLFTSNPLHPEVVSWVIGRVDSVCVMFFLAACWLYVVFRQEKKSRYLFLAALAFTLSLLSKEMAIVLPPVLFFAELILLGSNEESYGKRLAGALRKTLCFWVLLVLYLGGRYCVLGTVFGGYSGSLGPELAGDFYQRWWKSGSLFKLFFPFNALAVSNQPLFVKLFAIAYAVAAAGFLIKVAVFRKAGTVFPLICFSGLFFVLSLLPLYQVFNLNDTLMCSRFVYLATAPLSMLLALLIYTPGFMDNGVSSSGVAEEPVYQDSGRRAGAGKSKSRAIVVAQALICAGLIVLFSSAAWKNNLPWSHAAAHIKAFRQAIENTAKRAGEGKIILLNIPQEVEGAHVLYNAAMLSVLLSPPLTVPGFAQKVITFEPVSYGDASLINVSRLKRLISSEKIAGIYYWSSPLKQLVPLQLKVEKPATLSLPVDFLPSDWQLLGDNKLSCLYVVSPPLSLNPLAIDELRVTMTVGKFAEAVQTPVIKLLWSGDTAPENSELQQPLLADGREHTYLFSLSEYKPWIASSRVTRLAFQIPFTREVQVQDSSCPIRITNVVLDNIDSRSIKLILDDALEGKDGIFQLFEPRRFLYDAGSVKGLSSCRLEVSPCNVWFEHATHTFRDKQEASQHLLLRDLKVLKGSFLLEPSAFPGSGFYSVRVLGDGSCYASDPIYLQVTK